MAARVAAVAAAIALIVGAIIVRDQVIEGGGDGGSTPADATGPLVCASELDSACGDASTAPLMSTFEALASAADRRDVELAAWLAPGPWPHIVQVARNAASAPQLEFGTVALAETDLVAVIRQKPSTCPAAVTWRCLGDAALANTARPALAAPSSATGVRLLALAALLGGRLDSTSYASNDLTGEALDWIIGVDRGVEAGRARGATTLRDFNLVPGADVFITTAADAKAARSEFQVVVPEPRAVIHAQVGYLRSEGRGENDRLADALIDAGWRRELDTPSGLPSPGVLLALREVTS